MNSVLLSQLMRKTSGDKGTFISPELAFAILKTFVQIRTNQPYGDEADLVNHLFSILSFEPGQTHIINHGNNRSSLVAKFKGKGNSNRTIALVCQADTSSYGDPEENKNYPLYRATLKDGYVYGRGTSNMKGGLTAAILALLDLLESRESLPVDVLLCVLADGEGFGLGAEAVIRGHYLDEVTELLFLEPTNCEIATAQKGAIWLKIHVDGERRHTCFTHRENNAIEILLSLFDKLHHHVCVEIEPHALLGSPSCSLTQIEGKSESINFAARHVEASLDIRLLPNQENRAILAFLDNLIVSLQNQIEGVKIERQVILDRSATSMPEDSPLARRFSKSVEHVGMTLKIRGYQAFTNVSLITPQLGIPFIIYGPGVDLIESTIDERVSLSSIVSTAQILKHFIQNSTID